MTKKSRKLVDVTSQLTIFDLLKKGESLAHGSPIRPAAGCLSYRPELCAAMAQDIKHATDDQGREISRHDVAAQMNNLLNRGDDKPPITINTLNSWTAPSHHKYTPDAMELSAFVRATGGQRRAIEVVNKNAGLFTLPGPDALRAETQKLKEQRERIDGEISKREILLKEVER